MNKIQFIKDNYLTMSSREIAEVVGMSSPVVRRIARESGIRKSQFKFELAAGEIARSVNFGDGNYVVTNFGRVANTVKSTLVALKEKKGYIQVGLCCDKKVSWTSAHRLVAFAFIPNSYPETKIQVNHIDGNKLNNRVENLEWVTPSENQIHAFETGLKHAKKGEDSSSSVVSEEQVREICMLLESGRPSAYVIRTHDFATKAIVEKIKNRKTWRHITKEYNF